MNGRDLMACAQSGSGKTAAFLLPIIHKIIESNADGNPGASTQTPQCVVITPTRELAIQIKDEARKFAMGSMVKSVVACGGTSVGYQLTQLEKGCNMLIATPGRFVFFLYFLFINLNLCQILRLLDFVDKGKVSFEDLKFLVLDKADRMLDMVN